MGRSKRKVWWTLSYKAKITCNEIWKLQDATELHNETTYQGDEKNDKIA